VGKRRLVDEDAADDDVSPKRVDLEHWGVEAGVHKDLVHLRPGGDLDSTVDQGRLYPVEHLVVEA